jgi:hypothetical protein
VQDKAIKLCGPIIVKSALEYIPAALGDETTEFGMKLLMLIAAFTKTAAP